MKNKKTAAKKNIVPNSPIKISETRLNLLKQYYLEVFKVEMLNLFIKNNNSSKQNKFNLVLADGEPDSNFGENAQNYTIAIWIKDYNKFLFKNRVIKLNFKSTKSKKWIMNNTEHEAFIRLVDLQVNEYCQKYMKTDKDFANIQKKNDNFQSKINNNNNNNNKTENL